MTIAVDTNVLLAVLHDDHRADAAEEALRDAYTTGHVVITPIVYAETAADGQFETDDDLDTFLSDMSIDVVQPSPEALFRSGEAFDTYTDRRPDELQCPGCGTVRTAICHECNRELTSRQHIAADFVIGGHAVTDADALVTFDTGFYGSFFPTLSVLPE
jgi:predicted nucleic acid-binding protein